MNRLLELLSPIEKDAKLFSKEPKSDSQNTITKIGGIPWWPDGIERPKDKKGRPMKFVAQINLADVDSIDLPDALVSFHYSVEDMSEGNMCFGVYDLNGNTDSYDIRVFTKISERSSESVVVDDAEAYHLSSKIVKLAPSSSEEMLADIEQQIENEIKNVDMGDLWDEAIEHYYREFEEGESHVGGYPQWWQDPEYPKNESGDEYTFVAYIDGMLIDAVESYLFVDCTDKENPKAEFVCQTT